VSRSGATYSVNCSLDCYSASSPSGNKIGYEVLTANQLTFSEMCDLVSRIKALLAAAGSKENQL